MKNKLLVILTLIVCLPLVALAWVGIRLARDEQKLVRQQLRELLTEQLRDADRMIHRHFQQRQREFLVITDLPSQEVDDLRQLVRSHPQIGQLLILKPDGRLQHPPLDGTLNASEQAFLQRAKDFLVDKDLIHLANQQLESSPPSGSEPGRQPDGEPGRQPDGEPGREAASEPSTERGTLRSETPHGWHVWYWGRGVNLVFWRRLPSGQVVGIELDRARWMADLIAALPDTPFDPSLQTHSRIQLVDSNDQTIYQWGDLEQRSDVPAFVELPLQQPLSSWRLKYDIAEEKFVALAPRSGYFPLFVGLGVAGLGLLSLAVYFYRESSREIREAATRVNFVNQVSHELKTPLTNIRMYAELLEHEFESLDDQDAEAARQRLQVIVSESGRLSRLIGNVLTFARQQRQPDRFKPRPGQVDETVHAVLRQFEPTMQHKGITVHFDGRAQHSVMVDRDVLEQVLVNLLSNVEKHAADGKRVDVESRQKEGWTTIRISDQGPGIPDRERERIFQPFYRLSDCLEGTSGTGIGLAIVRNLARLHGGDVICLKSESGAVLEVELRTPSTESGQTVTKA